jgi:cyclase
MLKKRLIACLLWRDGMLVQSKNFQHTNSVGSAFVAVDFFNTWAIDEIVLLDVTRNLEKRKRFHEDVKELSKRCFVPLAIGGWIKSIDDIRTLLQEGADKTVINTEAVKNPLFIKEASDMFGSQCIVVSIDVKKDEKGKYHVFIDRGKVNTNLDPVKWAKQVEKLGAGEIFLTSIDNDGSGKGYDLDITKRVAEAVSIPVIASGGVGEWKHFVDGIKAGNADAVSAANIFHYSEQSTKKAKNYLFESGIDVRKPEFYNIIVPRNPVYKI